MSRRRLLFAAPMAFAAGCAVTPEANRYVESARSTYLQAAASPEVQLRAPVELQVAERSLADADRLWKGGADPALVAHQAYLAEQRARIAMATADHRKAEAAVATAGEQRNRVLLEARTRELDAQKRERRLAGDALAEEMENLAQFMRKDPGSAITIEGFTDSTGSDELNRRLSEQRAQAVKEALVARGIEARRIQARGYGPAFPVASNDTAVGRQLNRRVQVVIATNFQ